MPQHFLTGAGPTQQCLGERLMLMGGIGKRPRTARIGYKAEQVVAFELRYFITHGRLPTQQEICSALGIRTAGEVSRIERSLRRRGLHIDRRDSANSLPRKTVINGFPT